MSACSQCGTPLRQDDRFCGNCGRHRSHSNTLGIVLGIVSGVILVFGLGVAIGTGNQNQTGPVILPPPGSKTIIPANRYSESGRDFDKPSWRKAAEGYMNESGHGQYFMQAVEYPYPIARLTFPGAEMPISFGDAVVCAMFHQNFGLQATAQMRRFGFRQADLIDGHGRIVSCSL